MNISEDDIFKDDTDCDLLDIYEHSLRNDSELGEDIHYLRHVLYRTLLPSNSTEHSYYQRDILKNIDNQKAILNAWKSFKSMTQKELDEFMNIRTKECPWFIEHKKELKQFAYVEDNEKIIDSLNDLPQSSIEMIELKRDKESKEDRVLERYIYNVGQIESVKVNDVDRYVKTGERKGQKYTTKEVIVEFLGGCVQKAVCDIDDTFSLERGIEICILKQIIGNRYHKTINIAVKVYKDTLKAEEKQKEAEELAKRKKEKAADKRAKRTAKLRERRIQEEAEIKARAIIIADKMRQEDSSK